MNKTGMYTYQGLRMGCKPFLYGIGIYREKRGIYLNETTLYENCRKLEYFAEIFEEMKRSNKISTTDPRHISTQEIEAFMGFMKNKGISAVTKRSYLKVLNQYLKLFNNNIIDDMKDNGKLRNMLKGETNPIRFLTVEELQIIFNGAAVIEGYTGIVLRGFLAISFGIAGRPKEIIGIQEKDIDLEKRMVFIRHPKGEGSYGKREWVPIIRGDMIPLIAGFLEERNRFLASEGIESPYLFYNHSTGEQLTLKCIREYKRKLERSTGVSFQLKDMRSSYATITYSTSPDLKDAISKQMRHSSTSITEKYYIAYTQRMAAEDLKEEWKKNPIHSKK